MFWLFSICKTCCISLLKVQEVKREHFLALYACCLNLIKGILCPLQRFTALQLPLFTWNHLPTSEVSSVTGNLCSDPRRHEKSFMNTAKVKPCFKAITKKTNKLRATLKKPVSCHEVVLWNKSNYWMPHQNKKSKWLSGVPKLQPSCSRVLREYQFPAADLKKNSPWQ